MALQTKEAARISDHGTVRVQVWVEYHDDDYQEINDDGDPDDFRVVRWFGENYHDRDLTVWMRRANGSSIATRTIVAGATFEQSAGGAVKYESDVPSWEYGWSD